jgi:hypothetical protein
MPPAYRRGHRACSSPGHPVTIPHASKKERKKEDSGQPHAAHPLRCAQRGESAGAAGRLVFLGVMPTIPFRGDIQKTVVRLTRYSGKLHNIVAVRGRTPYNAIEEM